VIIVVNDPGLVDDGPDLFPHSVEDRIVESLHHPARELLFGKLHVRHAPRANAAFFHECLRAF